MRITLLAAFVAITFFCTFVFARNDEKVDVEVANIGLADVNITLIAKPDHHFAVADKLLDTVELKAFLAEQRKDHAIQYVLVSGEKMTIGDLVAVAHIGEVLGFTVLFESKGQLKTLKMVK
jgi:hypothetical protein